LLNYSMCYIVQDLQVASQRSIFTARCVEASYRKCQLCCAQLPVTWDLLNRKYTDFYYCSKIGSTARKYSVYN